MKRQGILEGFRAPTTRFSRATHRSPPAHDKMGLRSHLINPVPSRPCFFLNLGKFLWGSRCCHVATFVGDATFIGNTIFSSRHDPFICPFCLPPQSLPQSIPLMPRNSAFLSNPLCSHSFSRHTGRTPRFPYFPSSHPSSHICSPLFPGCPSLTSFLDILP